MRRFGHGQRSYGPSGGPGRPPTAGLMVSCHGHMSGTAADSTEDCQSGAMKRHLGAKSSQFLLSKEEALARYIQENRRVYDQLVG